LQGTAKKRHVKAKINFFISITSDKSSLSILLQERDAVNSSGKKIISCKLLQIREKNG
jgi:hypothetical protein